MRKYFLSILLTSLCGMSFAQVVQENEIAIVYYMPKTELAITMNYEIIEQTPGIFYQYAERYLGAKDIIMSANTISQLKDIQIGVKTSADTERACKVIAPRGFNTQLLTLSDDGRLLGYNIGPISQENTTSSIRTTQAPQLPTLMPLLEEHFMASSTAKMAEGAAKQIYRIRETRLNILGGDVEHVPADGDAMKQVLDELNKQEQMLVALFVGTTSVTQRTQTIYYTPTESVEDEIICRFSQYNGIVDSNDLSGEPIFLSLVAKKQALQANLESTNKTIGASQLYYNLPGEADVKITFKNKIEAHGKFAIAQYGVSIPLSNDLFTGRTLTTIYINPQTGNIQSIQR